MTSYAFYNKETLYAITMAVMAQSTYMLKATVHQLVSHSRPTSHCIVEGGSQDQMAANTDEPHQHDHHYQMAKLLIV